MNCIKVLEGSDVSRKMLRVNESNGNIGMFGVLYNNLFLFCGCLYKIKVDIIIVLRIIRSRNMDYYDFMQINFYLKIIKRDIMVEEIIQIIIYSIDISYDVGDGFNLFDRFIGNKVFLFFMEVMFIKLFIFLYVLFFGFLIF